MNSNKSIYSKNIFFIKIPFFLVALSIVQILIALAVTGFAIAASALSCKVLCCQNKTQGAILNQPGLIPFYHFTIFTLLYLMNYSKCHKENKDSTTQSSKD
jgi:hypothetical protein